MSIDYVTIFLVFQLETLTLSHLLPGFNRLNFKGISGAHKFCSTAFQKEAVEFPLRFF